MKGKLTVGVINQRLKAGKIGVSVLQRGDRLYLQGTFPPKPGKTAPSRQISLGIYANEFGLAEAEALAQKLGSDLARGQFDWSDWIDRSEYQEQRDFCEAKVEAYRKFLWNSRLDGGDDRKDKMWRRRYYNPGLKWLPEGTLTKEAIVIAALHHAPNTRSRQLACQILGQFAKWSGIEVDLSPYQGRYSVAAVDRNIPTDEEIVAAIDRMTNPNWQWVAGMMAAFGLRDHECWLCRIEFEEDPLIGQIPIAVVYGGKTYSKTGERISRPLPLEWCDRWNLAAGSPPQIRVKVNEEYGERTARQFKRCGIGFSPYDLRHAYAIRSSVTLSMPVSVSAAHLGHSPHVHLSTYNKHLSEAQKKEAYRKATRPST